MPSTHPSAFWTLARISVRARLITLGLALLSISSASLAQETPAPSGASSPTEPSHWAFRPPLRPPLPPVTRADWVENPIDAFILARLEAEGLTPSPEADRHTLARRLSLEPVLDSSSD
jgi:hypothetical protein